MDITNRIKNALAAFRKQENGTVGYDPNTFLKYGSRRMHQTWSTPEITDQDFYTGYGFAVINKRANRSVVLGKKFLYTDANEEIIARANEEGIRVVHPYLSLIRSSTEFSERDFWYEISTYLDLEGIYYLMAVRTVAANGRVGNIQKFSLLNPYNVRKVVDSKGNVGGYVEERNGMQRQIPAEMIIPIKLLNPFKPDRPYSLADAARDSQFTLKQANDFAREAIDGNLNAPGIISSAIELPDDQFDNFVSRIKNKGRGEPLFGNGAGTISWVDMQTDLDKAALDKINSINRDTLLAISGLSKTGVGVEESGTGREVSRTQKDDFTENAVMPQIENIIDALNLDYRKYYQTEWERNGYTIALDNPLETDRDAEQKDVEIRDSQFKLLQSLEAAGYPYDIAAKYSKGLIDITDIGEVPVTAEDETPTGDGQDPNEPDNSPSENDVSTNSYEGKSFSMYEGYPIPVVQYLEELSDQINPLSEKGSLIYSTYEPKTVRINKIVEDQDALIALVDEDTFIKLGEFHQNADRIAILTKLNKRYKNQPVAIKKKFELSEEVKVENQVELNVPKYIQDAAARGLELYKQGFGGDGLVDRTIREARLMARGEISEDKVIRANAWGARHAVDLRVPRNSDPQHEDWPGASAVAHYLWGIDPVNPEASRRWFERKAEAIKAERDSSYGYEYDDDMMKKKKKKKKINEIRVDGHLDHDCDNQVYEVIKNLAFDKQEQIDSNTQDLQQSAKAAEDRIYDWYNDQISQGVLNPRLENKEDYINSMTLPFAVYFTVMWPIYASYRVQKTAEDLNIKDELPVVALTDELKQKINDFAKNEATSHVNTINTDIQNALAVIIARTSDPAQIKAEFQQAFNAIQERRSIAIANNAAARIFNISQYEADLQFLTRAGLLNNAYKVLFSLTGDPCPICASIIAQTNAKPIPFTNAFASLGQTIEADGQKYVFNYEEIISGNVHPNCRCAYRLVIDNNVG